MTLNDIMRVSYFGTLAGQRIMTVHYGRVSTIVDTPYRDFAQNIATDLAADCAGAGFWGDVRGELSDSFQFDYLRVQRIFPNREIYSQATINAAGGTMSPASAPTDTAAFEKRTLFPGRKGHGDLHLAGLPANKQALGLWDAAQLTVLRAFLAQLTVEYTGASGNGLKWGLFAPGIAPPNHFDQFVEVTSFPQVRTMHRRTVGLGE